jgi:hypothetical protein
LGLGIVLTVSGKAKQKQINHLREQLQEKRLALGMEMPKFCHKKPDGTLA